jgi:hypothetical protein
MRSVDGLPDLLTVEEAAAVLRIGRTKAYDLAREWRATGGASGLPVLDLGNVLRVSRYALEDMVGGPLNLPTAREAPAASPELSGTPESSDALSPRPRGRTRARDCDQLDLFDASTRS